MTKPSMVKSEDTMAEVFDAYDRWQAARRDLQVSERDLRALLSRARNEGYSVNRMAQLLEAPVMNIWRWSGGHGSG